MKKIICIIALLFSCTGFSAVALEVGKVAPDFVVTDIAGKSQSIAAYKGKIVVLEWTNPGCPFVRKHYGSENMQKLQEYATGKGVVWLSVNSSAVNKEGNLDAEGAQHFIEEHHAHPTAYILDPEGTLGHLYGAKATPHMYVIAADGTLAYEGAIDDIPSPDQADIALANNYVKQAVDALLLGHTPATQQTRAYGCSVKYKD